VIEVRAMRAFDSVDDMARRAELDQQDLKALAAANALFALAGHRRQANWEVAALLPVPALLRHATITETALTLPAASEGHDIVADFRSTGLTLNRHPLALLRPRLRQMHLATALELKGYGNGKLVRTSGLVTMRQRPGTAKGTMFITLEDETGVINVILWKDVQERDRLAVLQARLMTVYGVWQCVDEVRHVIAKKVLDHSALLGQLQIDSRNFH
jgi:error-prone DNA polymerase